jgi:hypothetical protein
MRSVWLTDVTGAVEVCGMNPPDPIEDSERLECVGSPTLLIDGCDPLSAPGAPVGLACRLYRTPDGLAGTPTMEQLMKVLS